MLKDPKTQYFDGRQIADELWELLKANPMGNSLENKKVLGWKSHVTIIT